MIDQTDNIENEFWHVMHRLSMWYRLRLTVNGAVKGLAVGLTAAIAVSLAAIITGFGIRIGLDRTAFTWLVIISAGVGSLGYAGLLFIWSKTSLRTARFFDQFYNLQDRLSTAVEILNKRIKAQNEGWGLGRYQVSDALEHGKEIKPGKYFFLSTSRPLSGFIVLQMLVVVLMSFIAESYFNQVSQIQTFRQSIQKEINALEQLQQDIHVKDQLPTLEKEKIDQVLQKAIQGLNESNTTEQAVAVLTQAESDLRSLADSTSEEQIQSLQEIGRQLDQNEATGESSIQDFAGDLAKGDLPAASQDLKNLDLNDLTSEQAKSLSEQLSGMASSLKDTNTELSQSLEEAAQSLLEGDRQSAQQALAQASDQLNQLESQQNTNKTIFQAADQTSQSAGQMAQSAASGQNQDGSDPANIPGNNPANSGQQAQPGASLNPGGASGSADQAGSSGSGTGSANQGNVSGNQAGEQPINQSNRPGDGGVTGFEPLANPQRLGGSSSTEVYLPESGSEGGDILGLQNSSPGEPGNANVPYTLVYPAYAEAYRQALETEAIPTALRELVRDYFSHLEP